MIQVSRLDLRLHEEVQDSADLLADYAEVSDLGLKYNGLLARDFAVKYLPEARYLEEAVVLVPYNSFALVVEPETRRFLALLIAVRR